MRLVEAKNPERIDQQRYNLRVGIYGGLAEDIGVILVKSAQPALLLALVTVIFTYGKPFDRPADCACARADHSGQRGRHFRTHSHGSIAFVDELKQLRLYLFAAFFGEELELFENRRLEFAKAVRARHGAPGGQEAALACEFFGIELPKARQCPELSHYFLALEALLSSTTLRSRVLSAALSSLPALNFTMALLGITTSWPGFVGLRPTLGLRT